MQHAQTALSAGSLLVMHVHFDVTMAKVLLELRGGRHLSLPTPQ